MQPDNRGQNQPSNPGSANDDTTLRPVMYADIHPTQQPQQQTAEQPYYAEDANATQDDLYQEDAGAQPDVPLETVRWQAKEFISKDKDRKWYTIFGIVAVITIIISIFPLKAYTFTALLIVIAVSIVIFAKRPPRIMNYVLTDKGLYIGETLHDFDSFKSFGVLHDGDEYSIVLTPVKRFMPSVTVYFPEESGEQIVDMFGARLPMKEIKLDFIDKVVRKLRL